MFSFILFVGLFGDIMWFLALVLPKSLDLFLSFSPNGSEMISLAENEVGRLALGIMGALMTGWALALFEATGSFPAMEFEWFKKRGNLMLSGLLAWFFMDSILSIATTFYWNIALNKCFLEWSPRSDEGGQFSLDWEVL